MKSDDDGVDFQYYFYALNNYYWTPSQWANMTQREKAVVIAGIDIRVKEEEKQQKEAERKSKRH